MENKSKTPASDRLTSAEQAQAVRRASDLLADEVLRPVDVAQAMHGQMVAAAAVRNALLLAGNRVAKAKARVEELAASIQAEQRRSADLKAQRSSAVDEMEAAVQAHDIAVRADQAARAAAALAQ